MAVLMAAFSGGCFSSFLGADRYSDPPVIHVGPLPESGLDLSSVRATPPDRGPGFWTQFEHELDRVTDGLAYRPWTHPLVEYAAIHTQDGYRPVKVDGNCGMLNEEDGLDRLGRNGRMEALRVIRRAFSATLRRQPVYRQAREVIQVALGGSPITHIEPGPVLEDPQRDHSYGASRLFAGFPGGSRIRSPKVSEVDSSFRIGMHPKVGFRWMRVYRFSWEPREDEMVHRLEYAIGPVGVGAAYRICGQRATEVGLGMQVPLGPMSIVTVSAGRTLYGADEEDCEPGSQRIMAELAWRF
jgi:hypothetical protein